MLGYRGRTGRRDFIAGVALLFVGTEAFSRAVRPGIPWVFDTFQRNVALAAALVLSLLVCATVVLWFWGWTALATRRARDIGLPAWAGVLSLFVLTVVGRWTAGLPAPFAMIVGWGVIVVWIAALAAPASAGTQSSRDGPDAARSTA